MPILQNSKHELFAQELAKGRSASAAYITAGFKAHGSNAARLSQNEHVRARVDELLAVAAEKAGVTIDRIVDELAKIGFSDIRKLVEWSGSELADEVDGEDGEGGVPKVVIRAANIVRLIGSDQIDDLTAATVSEVSQTKEGSLRVKLHDKLGALDKLGRHLGMFKEKVEHSGPGGGPIETRDMSDIDKVKALAALMRRAKAA